MICKKKGILICVKIAIKWVRPLLQKCGEKNSANDAASETNGIHSLSALVKHV